MDNTIRTLDYYFFGIGVMSLVSAFFLLDKRFEFYYVFFLFFFVNFLVSFFLNTKLLRKLNEIYIWDARRYFLGHSFVAFVSSQLTVVFFIFIENIFMLVSSFLAMNFFVMAISLMILIREESRIRWK
jgi:hypothetical protein